MTRQQKIPVVDKLRQLTSTSLYRNAGYLIGVTSATSFLGFFFWILVARGYDEVVVGYSSAVLSAINLISIISLVGLNSVIIRYSANAERPRQLINTCLTLAGLFSLVLAIIFVSGLDIWSPAIAFIVDNYVFAAAFVAFTLVSALLHIADATITALRRSKYSFYRNVIFSLLKIPLPLIFLPVFHTFGIVASWGIAAGVSLVIALFWFLPRVQPNYRPLPAIRLPLIKDTWRYSLGNYLANLLSSAPNLLFPLMVVNLLNAANNAYFYMPWMIAGIIFAVPHSIATSLFAEGSHFAERLRGNTIRSVKFSLVILVPAILVLVFSGKWLLLAFGQDYVDNGLSLMQVLALSSLPLSINHAYTSVLRVTFRIKELVIFQGIATGVVLLASYFAIPSLGILGIGYAWLFSQLGATVFIISSRRLFLHSVK